MCACVCLWGGEGEDRMEEKKKDRDAFTPFMKSNKNTK